MALVTPHDVFRRNYIIKRPGTGTYANGVWVEDDYVFFNALLSLQPEKGLIVEFNADGRRESQILKCYTNFTIKTENANPDILIANGYEYELAEIQPWQNNIINHYKVIAIKRGAAPEFIDEARITTSNELRITASDQYRVVS